MQILQQILEERGSQYGSFEVNMMLVAMLYDEIMPTTELFSAMCKLDSEGKHRERAVANSTLRFAQNMMSLKAVRSLTATGESFKDCIYDFLNYKMLCERVLGKICPSVTEFFIFSKELFNQQIDEDMAYILNRDEVNKKFSTSVCNIDIEKE